ncbi:MAG: carbon-nitrogen hydrolase family protein [Pseudomonadota bacterium]
MSAPARPLRIALIQMTSGEDPAANLAAAEAMLREAAAGGAELALTPEVTNLVTLDRAHQRAVLRSEVEDPTLAGLRGLAAELGIWLSIGSLAVDGGLGGRDDGRAANRQFLLAPDGGIVARYDKIHMFDVAIGGADTFRESDNFRPGEHAVLADTPFARLGLTICYDMRFPALHRALAEGGAEIITSPAAFTVPTGRAHWEVLLRARAIETGSFVLAAAQVGHHPSKNGRDRQTWGHSLAVAPWGEVLADGGGEGPGVIFADLDLAAVAEARRRIPCLANARAFEGPEPQAEQPAHRRTG